MRIIGLKTVVKSARWVRSRFVNGALILAYHRVVDSTWDPYEMNTQLRHFEEQLEVLRERAHPIGLEELVNATLSGNVVPRSVAVTLDDGYVDNLRNAKPLLERYDIPATVFVTTGNMGHAFWWDEVANLLKPSVSLPEKLRLTCNGQVYERPLRQFHDAEKRNQLVVSVYDFLRVLAHHQRQDGIHQLRDCVSGESKDDPDMRAMTPNELTDLAAGGLIQIGAHTVTHPFLATMASSVQRSEIQESKLHLEQTLGSPITSFSFPNGSLSKQSPAIVRESGFSCACASHSDVVWRGSDRFRLPRLWPQDWDGARFAAWLEPWLHS